MAKTIAAPFIHSIRGLTIIRKHRETLRTVITDLSFLHPPIPHPPALSAFSPLPLPLQHSSSFSSIMSCSTNSNDQGDAATNPPAQPSMPTKTVRAMMKGRVQGVFYRNWTVENARELGLKGWVRNRRDGSVEALFSGNPDSVHEMEQRCRRGPPDAIVTGFQVFPSNDDPGSVFERKPTV